MTSVPLGVIIAGIMLIGFAIWGVIAFRHRVDEKPTETSSHY
ncbi:MAG: hypothetical protein ABIO40_01260 [Devosia sp.]